MQKDNNIFITGHRHPDTDSIVSAIAYAHFKNELGIPAVACRLGSINEETEYLLKRFNAEKPVYLKDARASLDEIEMDEATTISMESSVKDAMDLIAQGKRTLAVVDGRGRLIGLVTISNLARLAMGDTAETIELLKRTPIENIARAIQGTLVYKPKEFHFDGKTSIIAIAESKLEHYRLKNRLVIIGNDVEAQKDAIRKEAACIVTVWTDTIDPEVIALAKEHDCAIIQSSHGSMNTSRYLLFAPSVREVMTTDLVSFNKNEFADDVGRKMLQTRFRSYPVTDDRGYLFAFVSRYHILNGNSKRLILVDHNEASQSVEGIEKAEVLEIIDHHKIGDLSTNKPIYFRNEIIGSTASIITKIYEENNVVIPKDIASLLLSALISDTLNLKSPTTTKEDLRIAKKLQEISELNRFIFAQEMYEATSNFKNKSYQEIINQDIKTFFLSNQEVMVSQVVVYHFEELETILGEFELEMNNFVERYRLDLLVVVFTSVVDNGSIILAAGKLEDAVMEAFPGETRNFLENVVSRKNQIIPRLSTAIAEYVGA